MIFYGHNSTGTGTKKSLVICPNCETQGSMTFNALSKYAHLYWIPFFPIGKTIVAHCGDCGSSYEEKGMPSMMKSESDRFKSTIKTPIWHFSGLGIVALLIVGGVTMSQLDNKKEAKYLANPMEGDIYTLKTENDYFTTYKVFDISEDSLFVIPNEYETSEYSGIDEIDIEANYGEFYYGIGRDMIDKMYEDNTIRNIER